MPSQRPINRRSATGRAGARVLARRMRAGDHRARDELITMYVPFAEALALRYRRRAQRIDDLGQVALLGLVKAVDRWDPDRGVELTTYATPTILGELRHYFRDQTWGINPPRRLQDLSSAIERSRDALRAELGRTPTLADLARRLDRSREEVLEALQATGGRSLESLDPAVYHEGDTIGCLGAVIPFDDPELERVEDRASLERLHDYATRATPAAALRA